MATNTRRMKDNAAKPTIANLRLVSSSAAKTKKKQNMELELEKKINGQSRELMLHHV